MPGARTEKRGDKQENCRTDGQVPGFPKGVGSVGSGYGKVS